jgi:hypothetical protein
VIDLADSDVDEFITEDVDEDAAADAAVAGMQLGAEDAEKYNAADAFQGEAADEDEDADDVDAHAAASSSSSSQFPAASDTSAPRRSTRGKLSRADRASFTVRDDWDGGVYDARQDEYADELEAMARVRRGSRGRWRWWRRQWRRQWRSQQRRRQALLARRRQRWARCAAVST